MILNDLKNKVITMLNESNLSIDAIYYVMKEIMQEVEMTYNRMLQAEAAAKDAPVQAEEEQPAPADVENVEEEKKD